MTERFPYATVAVTGVVAILIRTLLLPYAGCISTDGVYYVEIANRYLQTGSAFDPLFPPLYPILIAWVSRLGFSLELAGRLVSTVAGSALIPAIAIVAFRFYGRNVARTSALLCCLHPLLAHYALEVMTESAFTCLVVCSLAVATATPSPWTYACTGGLLGLAGLLRPEAAIWMLVNAGYVFFRDRRRASLNRAARNAALVIGLFGCVVLPYVVSLNEATGRWTLSGKSDLMMTKARAVGNVDIGRRIAELQESEAQTPVRLSEHILRIATNLHLLDRSVLPQLFPPLLLVLVAIGLWHTPRDRPHTLLLLYVIAASPILFVMVEPRFFLAVVPIGLVWAARGIEILSRTHPVAVRWATAGIVVLLLPYLFRPMVRPNPNEIYAEAGRWLRDTVSVEGVAFTKPWIAHYAGAPRISIPVTGPAGIADELKRRGATHLVIDNRHVPRVRPDLAEALYRAPMGLRKLHSLRRGSDHLVIYAVNRSSDG